MTENSVSSAKFLHYFLNHRLNCRGRYLCTTPPPILFWISPQVNFLQTFIFVGQRIKKHFAYMQTIRLIVFIEHRSFEPIRLLFSRVYALIIPNIGCETKLPIIEWDKAADFENGTKSPILMMRRNGRIQSGTKPSGSKFWLKILCNNGGSAEEKSQKPPVIRRQITAVTSVS